MVEQVYRPRAERPVAEGTPGDSEPLPWERGERAPPPEIASPSSGGPPSEMDRLIARADAGDVEVILDLVERLIEGEPVPYDNAKALQWMRVAIEAEHAGAQTALGVIYLEGLLGLPENIERAAHWLRLSAQQGNADGQALLGAIYLMEPDRQDYVEAHYWLRRSAAQENPFGQFCLGFQYAEGLGVPENPAEAIRLWRLAAGQGEPHAAFELGLAYEEGFGVPASLDKAREWYRKAAEWGHPEAAESLDLLNRTPGRPTSERPQQNRSAVDEAVDEIEQLGRDILKTRAS